MFNMFVLFFSTYPSDVHPYIDPGTGSIIIQVIIGVLVGGMFIGKIFWNKIKIFFMSLFSIRQDHDKEDKE